jgi:death-on-curing protein
VIYLDLEDVLHIADRVLEGRVEVRDPGLLAAAVARPQTTVFQQDAYPSVHEKAGALLHSIVNNHALVDGNKRLGLASAIGFLGLNGWRLTLTNAEAFDLVIAVAEGRVDEVVDIAQSLKAGSRRARSPR